MDIFSLLPLLCHDLRRLLILPKFNVDTLGQFTFVYMSKEKFQNIRKCWFESIHYNIFISHGSTKLTPTAPEKMRE